MRSFVRAREGWLNWLRRGPSVPSPAWGKVSNSGMAGIVPIIGRFSKDMEKIHTAQAPEAIGPYSQAIKANGMVFLSGQIPLDPGSMLVIEGGIAEQTEQVFQNLIAVLNAAGTSLDKVVKTSVFLADMSDFVAMNEVYAKYFSNNRPARSTVQAARLPRDVKVEIDLIALA